MSVQTEFLRSHYRTESGNSFCEGFEIVKAVGLTFMGDVSLDVDDESFTVADPQYLEWLQEVAIKHFKL